MNRIYVALLLVMLILAGCIAESEGSKIVKKVWIYEKENPYKTVKINISITSQIPGYGNLSSSTHGEIDRAKNYKSATTTSITYDFVKGETLAHTSKQLVINGTFYEKLDEESHINFRKATAEEQPGFQTQVDLNVQNLGADLVGEEEIGGTPAYVIRGDMNPQAGIAYVQMLYGDAITADSNAPVEYKFKTGSLTLWIGKEQQRMLKSQGDVVVEIAGVPTNTSITETRYGYDEPVIMDDWRVPVTLK